MNNAFYEISEDVKNTFMEIFKSKKFPINIKLQFIGNDKQKNLIKISLLQPKYSFILNKDILVSINESMYDVFESDNMETIKILFEQEIDKIQVNIETGKIKLIKPDIETFSFLIKKYGVEKITNANKIEELYNQRLKDVQIVDYNIDINTF